MLIKINLDIDDDYLLDSMIQPVYYIPDKIIFLFKDDRVDLVCDGTNVARFYSEDFNEYHHLIKKLTIKSSMCIALHYHLMDIWSSIFETPTNATITMNDYDNIVITVGSKIITVPVYDFDNDDDVNDDPIQPIVTPAFSGPFLPSGEDVKCQSDNDDPCQTCEENKLCTINLPCAHLYFCIKCSNDYVLKYNKTTCPICNTKMTEIKQFYK